MNVVEEVENPSRTMPMAIGLTLLISTLVYVGVSAAAVALVAPDRLAASDAPLAEVYDALGLGRAVVTAIAVVATLNGVIVQIIMASRVLYGLAQMKRLPDIFRPRASRYGDTAPWNGHRNGHRAGTGPGGSDRTTRRSDIDPDAADFRAGEHGARRHQAPANRRTLPAQVFASHWRCPWSGAWRPWPCWQSPPCVEVSQPRSRTAASAMRWRVGDASLASQTRFPALRRQELLWLEARLVGHLR